MRNEKCIVKYYNYYKQAEKLNTNKSEREIIPLNKIIFLKNIFSLQNNLAITFICKQKENDYQDNLPLHYNIE